MLTIPDRSNISLMKYPIMAKQIKSEDSPIAEWEMNLKFFSIRAAITPSKVPTAIEAPLREKKFPIIPKNSLASTSGLSPSYLNLRTKSFIV